ncbi:MAG: hypothetical protein ACKVQC_01335, partial [Elusimicrobiota bacterium]
FSSVESTWLNSGQKKTLGSEFQLNWNKRVHFSWVHQKSKSMPLGSTSFKSAALSPEDVVHVRLIQPLPRGVLLTNRFRYQSEQFEGESRSGIKIPGSYIWDLLVDIKFLKANAYFEIHNLAKRRYSEFIVSDPAGNSTLSPQPERTFWTGIQIKFQN